MDCHTYWANIPCAQSLPRTLPGMVCILYCHILLTLVLLLIGADVEFILTLVLFHACAVHAISVVLKRHEFIVNVIRPLPFM